MEHLFPLDAELCVGSLDEQDKGVGPEYGLIIKQTRDGSRGVATITNPKRSDPGYKNGRSNQDTALSLPDFMAGADGIGSGRNGARASAEVMAEIRAKQRHPRSVALRLIDDAHRRIKRQVLWDESGYHVHDNSPLNHDDGTTLFYVRPLGPMEEECDMEFVHSGDSPLFHLPKEGAPYMGVPHGVVGYLVHGGVAFTDLYHLFIGAWQHALTDVLTKPSGAKLEDLHHALRKQLPSELAEMLCSSFGITRAIMRMSEEQRRVFRRILVKFFLATSPEFTDDVVSSNFERFPQDMYRDTEASHLMSAGIKTDRDDVHFERTVRRVKEGDVIFGCTDGVTGLVLISELFEMMRRRDFVGLMHAVKGFGPRDDTTTAWWIYQPTVPRAK